MQFSVRHKILRSFLDDFKISKACSVKWKINFKMNTVVRAYEQAVFDSFKVVLFYMPELVKTTTVFT